jgi:class 3 adenylate cyclase
LRDYDEGRMSAEGPNVQRRLAAVLAADVVGYSRLMEVDEAGTLARLKTVRLELIDPAITKCKGRIIKTTGDGLLVEFQSVTEAGLARPSYDHSAARSARLRAYAPVAISEPLVGYTLRVGHMHFTTPAPSGVPSRVPGALAAATTALARSEIC